MLQQQLRGRGSQPVGARCRPAHLSVSSNLQQRHTGNTQKRSEAACAAKEDQHEPQSKLHLALGTGACSLLLSASAATAALLEVPSATPTAPSSAAQQQQQQQQIARSPVVRLSGYSLTAATAPPVAASTAQHSTAAFSPLSTQQQEQQQVVQQQAPVQELLQLAQRDDPRIHWLLVVLGIGVVNVLGLQAVLKLLQASRDSSTPVTVLVCRMGLRTNSNKLQERLHFLRGMMGVEHALFFTFEEAVQAICNPPRDSQLAYADLQAKPLGSKQAGYDLFKQKAQVEQARAQQEEAAKVLHGTRPEGPHHRNVIQKLLGAEATQDAEEAQSCLLVTLVVLAKGTVALPAQPVKDVAVFRESMKSLCGHLKLGQLLAVELLMTPDSPQDFLSEAQLISDYPFLTDLASGLRVDDPRWRAAPSPSSSMDDFGAGNIIVDAAAFIADPQLTSSDFPDYSEGQQGSPVNSSSGSNGGGTAASDVAAAATSGQGS